MRWFPSPLAVLAASVFGVSCGSSGSGSGPLPVADNQAPRAVVQFPPDGCLTDAARVTLTIATTDESGVELVEAEGQPARLDSDGRWRVSVPLTIGHNQLRVRARDARGNQNGLAALVSVQRESLLWMEPTGVAIDPVTREGLVLDSFLGAVLRVGADGSREPITGLGIGSGQPLERPYDMEVAATSRAAVVTDQGLPGVVLVDLSTGERRILTSPTIGAGPVPIDPRGIAVDLLRDRALFLDAGRAELMEVDLETGRRRTLSGPGAGSGSALTGARAIALDARRNRALVTLEAEPVILAVDLASGDRTVATGGTSGLGPSLVAPGDLAVDLARDRAFVLDPGAGALFEVELASGARRILSSSLVGVGPIWTAPRGLALRIDGVLLVTDSLLDALFEVDRGDRRILSGISLGAGPPIRRPVAIDASPLMPEHLLVGEQAGYFLTDAATGTRQLLGTLGPIVDVAAFRGPTRCFAVLVGLVPEVFLFQPGPFGPLVTSGSGGPGPPFVRPRCMVPEPSVTACSSAVVLADQPAEEPAALLRIDLVTGTRLLLSGPTLGAGPDMLDPVAIEFDVHPTEVNLSVLDAELRGLFTVDYFAGDRSFQPLSGVEGRPTDLARTEEGFLLTTVEPPALLHVTDGQASVVSNASRGAGPILGRLVALGVAPSPSSGTIPPLPVAFVVDDVRSCVLAIDVASGERLIRTK